MTNSIVKWLNVSFPQIFVMFALFAFLAVSRTRIHQAESNGATVNVNIEITGDINKLVDQIAKYIGVALTVSKVNRCDLSGGGLFYSGNQNGVVFSAVYHPTRQHSASVRPGSNAGVFPSTKAWVAPGKWAISYTTASKLGGNKAYYDLK